NGNAQLEPGAIVCRVAPSFTRFGNFQIFSARNDQAILKQLVDYTIRHDFPHLGEPSKETYVAWYQEVSRRTVEMIIHWMRVGFVHGVMNTDNMSILGLTIDYGPYGWLEDYNPGWTPNTTDAQFRRYRFGNQPEIAQWNLMQLGNAIAPLVGETEPLQDTLNLYAEQFFQGYQTMMANKLGLASHNPDSDAALIGDLQKVLMATETDMTIFFRKLADLPMSEAEGAVSDDQLMVPLLDAYYTPEALTTEIKAQIGDWLRRYQNRVRQDNRPDSERRQQMNSINPKYVLRNYMAQLAIDQAETGDYSLVWELLELLRHPYDEQPSMEKHAAKRPDWARHRAGCSMLSCSS
ncbi:MAG: protein adenylyltransferase SelO family protein, partial [Chloroflexota bacterium]